MTSYAPPILLPGSLIDAGRIHTQIALIDGTSASNSILVDSLAGVQLDTGSCGLVVSAALFFENGQYTFTPNPDGGGSLTGQTLAGITIGDYTTATYSSDEDSFAGFHITIPSLAFGCMKPANGPDPSKVTCSAVATNVSAIAVIGRILPTGEIYTGPGSQPFMCGVGFGRYGLGSNILINAQTPDGTPIYSSFLFTNQGVWLGYQQSANAGGVSVNTAIPGSSFSFQTLSTQPVTQLSQCPAPTATFSIGSAPGDSMDVSLLVDTGIEYMIANVSSQIAAGLKVSGTTVTISIDQTNLSYSFTRPYDGTPGAPITVVSPQVGQFVNTGLNFLQAFQYYFDWPNTTVGVAKYPA